MAAPEKGVSSPMVIAQKEGISLEQDEGFSEPKLQDSKNVLGIENSQVDPKVGLVNMGSEIVGSADVQEGIKDPAGAVVEEISMEKEEGVGEPKLQESEKVLGFEDSKGDPKVGSATRGYEFVGPVEDEKGTKIPTVAVVEGPSLRSANAAGVLDLDKGQGGKVGNPGQLWSAVVKAAPALSKVDVFEVVEGVETLILPAVISYFTYLYGFWNNT